MQLVLAVRPSKAQEEANSNPTRGAAAEGIWDDPRTERHVPPDSARFSATRITVPREIGVVRGSDACWMTTVRPRHCQQPPLPNERASARPRRARDFFRSGSASRAKGVCTRIRQGLRGHTPGCSGGARPRLLSGARAARVVAQRHENPRAIRAVQPLPPPNPVGPSL